MRKLVIAAALVAAAVGAVGGTARADGPPVVVVDAPTCVYEGGVATVPAGSLVRFKVAWLAKNRGLARAAENDMQISMSGPSGALSGSWDPTIYAYDGVGWYSIWNTWIGPVDAPVTIQTTGTFDHPLPDLLTFNADGTPYLYDGALWDGSCTIVPE